MASLIDDRGRPAPFLLSRREGVADWPVRGDERIGRLVDRVGLVVRPGCLTTGVLMLAAGAVFAAVTLGMVVARPDVYARIGYVWNLGGVGLGSAVGWLQWRWHAARRRAEVCKLLLQEGLCPACGYNYSGLTPESDGCIVCPECGVAWRESRIVRAEPFGPSSTLAPARKVLARTRAPRRTARWAYDDRGVFVQIAAQPPRPGPAWSTDDVARLYRASSAWARQGRRTRRVLAGTFFSIGLGALGYLMGSLWITSISPAPIMIALLLFAVAACLGIAGAVLRGNLGREPRDVIRLLAAEGFCPSCTADLSAATAEDGGCVVCLSCGAAWQRRG